MLASVLCSVTCRMQISDETARHRTLGARADARAPCSVEVVSEAFEGKRRVERHRMVYAALGSELKEGLHALSLKLNTPSELA